MDDHDLYKRLNAMSVQIGALERKLDFLFRHLGVAFDDPGPAPDDIDGMILSGDMIGAIRLYRERYGAGLADAKAAVEERKARRGL